jgi:hypothetical protein
METFIALYSIGCLLSWGIGSALKDGDNSEWKLVGITFMSWFAVGAAIGIYIKLQEDLYNEGHREDS